MAFADLKKKWASTFPEGTPQRVKDLDALDRLRDGSIYSILPHAFSEEFEDIGTKEPIPLEKRRPSVRFDLAKVIVDETSAMAFGTGHSPYAEVYDPMEADDVDDTEGESSGTDTLNKIIQYLRQVTKMDAVMVEAMIKGSSGSAAIILKLKKNGTPWFRVVEGKFGFPTFSDDDPDKVMEFDEIYETTADELLKRGYTWAELRDPHDPNEVYKPSIPFMINLRQTAVYELWMVPLRKEQFAQLGLPKDEKDPDLGVHEWEEDPTRRYPHSFDEVPVMWVRNLQEREEIDGPCIFSDVADIILEIDYLLSQTGRGFKYSMDPLMAFEKDALAATLPLGQGSSLGDSYTAQVNIHRTPARAISTEGNVKMLEIAGNGLNAAKDFIKLLREWALEVIGGMKSDQEHSGGPQSGRALEILHQALVWLVDRLRTDYGDGLMVPLIMMCIRGLRKGNVKLLGLTKEQVPDIELPIRLVWPEWWLPRGADLFQTAQALQIAAGGSATEPKQMLPMTFIFASFAQALGLPDPNRVARKALAEFNKYIAVQQAQNAPKPATPPTGGGS
jgi:hypothetical protein